MCKSLLALLRAEKNKVRTFLAACKARTSAGQCSLGCLTRHAPHQVHREGVPVRHKWARKRCAAATASAATLVWVQAGRAHAYLCCSGGRNWQVSGQPEAFTAAQDVRKAVLAALPAARGSAPLAELVERTRDVSDEVRPRF